MPLKREGEREIDQTDIDVATVAEKVLGLTGRVDRMFGDLTKATADIAKLFGNCVGHQQMQLGLSNRERTCERWHEHVSVELGNLQRCSVDEKWCDRVDSDLKALEIARTEMNTATKTTLTILGVVATVLTIYNTVLVREATARQHVPEPAAQHQGK